MVKCANCKCSVYFIKVGEIYCSKHKRLIESIHDICDENVEDINENFNITEMEEK